MTGRHAVVELADRAAWEAALARVPHTWGHTWTAAAATPRRSGDRAVLCTWQEGDAARLVLPLVVRAVPGDDGYDVASPPGFSGPASTGDCTGWAESWSAFAASQEWITGYLTLSPVLADPVGLSHSSAVVRQPVYLLDLVQGEAALLAAMSASRRRQLRRWSDDSPLQTDDRERALAFLERRGSTFYDERGATALRDLSAASWRVLLEDQRVLVRAVVEDQAVTAAFLFGTTAEGTDYLHGISAPGAEHHSAGLLWSAVRALLADGVPLLNLGGGIRSDDGVAVFKQRFGPRAVHLRALHQVYRHDEYARLCRRAGRDHDDGGWFPSYRGDARDG